MKKLIIIIAILITHNCFSQTDSLVSFIGVVDVSNNKLDLFKNGREWFFTSFKDSKAVLKIEDKESGELSGNGVFQIYVPFRGGGIVNPKLNAFYYINFQVSLKVKDDKYKYAFTEFNPIDQFMDNAEMPILTNEETAPKAWNIRPKHSQMMYDSVRVKVSDYMNSIILSLKNKMKQKNDF